MSAPSSDRAYEIPKQMAMPKGRHYRLFAVLCAFDNDNLKTHVSWKGRWWCFFLFLTLKKFQSRILQRAGLNNVS